MKPPKSVKIGPHKFTVEYDARACDTAGVVGACLEDEARIILDPQQAKTQQRETLLHETLHGVWGQTWMDNPYPDGDSKGEGELMVKELASRFLLLLRDNPRLIAFLTEEDK